MQSAVPPSPLLFLPALPPLRPQSCAFLECLGVEDPSIHGLRSAASTGWTSQTSVLCNLPFFDVPKSFLGAKMNIALTVTAVVGTRLKAFTYDRQTLYTMSTFLRTRLVLLTYGMHARMVYLSEGM